MAFQPKLDILPKPQRSVWKELTAVPSDFVLYGGTAIALHLGHRESLDFDFFGKHEFNPQDLLPLPFLAGAQILQQQHSTLTCLIDRSGPVRVSFFGVPKLGRVQDPLVAHDNRLQIAAPIDLAGMKAAVVQQRSEAKDYIDLDALIRSGISLPQALAAAAVIYGKAFNPQITLKALCYFDDGDLSTLPHELRQRLVVAVDRTDLNQLRI